MVQYYVCVSFYKNISVVKNCDVKIDCVILWLVGSNNKQKSQINIYLIFYLHTPEHGILSEK